MFPTYFELGLTHILDLQGYDHMLFLAVLIAGFHWNEWKTVLWMITAFTLGHSLTLAITVLNGPVIESNWVEILIPLTIFSAAFSNLVWKRRHVIAAASVTTFFGLIHGMGFAGYLSALLPTNSELWQPLLFFNLGVEAGQIIFATLLITLLFITRSASKSAVRIAQTSLSVVGLVISLFLAFTNWIS
ncbi:MAG: HupE/UreJ family protein [Flavobacteriales bacterium]|nr:HupE/UreJ family protein [Flavobacteriales bacterium]